MNKHHLHQLLTRYRNGSCTEQEKRLAEQWFALIDGEETHNTPQENLQIEEKIWTAIRGNQRSASSFKAKLLPLLSGWRWVAAAVLLAVIWSGYQFTRSGRSGKEVISRPSPGAMTSKKNNTSEPLLMTLEDGTKVSLLPESSIEYPLKFRPGCREVYLKGKAFFNVTKDPKRSFFVYTGAIATRVLGTSFWVDFAEDNNDVEVSVVTGSVSVFQRHDVVRGTLENMENGVSLTPNQRVNYTHENRSFVKGLVREPVMLDSYAGAFVFSDTPLSEVADLLGKAYGIEIVLENEKLNYCFFTGDINKQPLFTKLDLISSAVNASYRTLGTRIVLSGKGCSSNLPLTSMTPMH